MKMGLNGARKLKEYHTATATRPTTCGLAERWNRRATVFIRSIHFESIPNWTIFLISWNINSPSRKLSKWENFYHCFSTNSFEMFIIVHICYVDFLVYAFDFSLVHAQQLMWWMWLGVGVCTVRMGDEQVLVDVCRCALQKGGLATNCYFIHLFIFINRKPYMRTTIQTQTHMIICLFSIQNWCSFGRHILHTAVEFAQTDNVYLVSPVQICQAWISPVLVTHSLFKYCLIWSKLCGNWWQRCKGTPTLLTLKWQTHRLAACEPGGGPRGANKFLTNDTAGQQISPLLFLQPKFLHHRRLFHRFFSYSI